MDASSEIQNPINNFVEGDTWSPVVSQSTDMVTDTTRKEVPIIFIEGGIGCGKSTLVKKIQDYCASHKLNIKTIQEPVDIWMEIKDEKTGKNMIEAFYENQEKYSFEFQMISARCRRY